MLKSIYIKNFKNLKGEHHLNFETTVLKKDGVLKRPILISKSNSNLHLLEAIDIVQKFDTLDILISDKAIEAFQKEANFDASKIEKIKNYIFYENFEENELEEMTMVSEEKVLENMLASINDTILRVEWFLSEVGAPSLSLKTINKLTKENMQVIGKTINTKINNFFKSEKIFNKYLGSIFNFSKIFKISVETTDNKIMSISNEDISEEMVKEKFSNYLLKYASKRMISPLWDMIELFTKLIEDSTRESWHEELWKCSLPSFKDSKKLNIPHTNMYDSKIFKFFYLDDDYGFRYVKNETYGIEEFTKHFGIKIVEKIFINLDERISYIKIIRDKIVFIDKEDKIIPKDAIPVGFNQFFELINFALKKKDNEFILVNEVEICLNITMIKLFYRLMDKLDIQIIATSSNPLFISSNIFPQSNIFINNGKSILKLKEVMEHEYPILLFKPVTSIPYLHIVGNAESTLFMKDFDYDKIDNLANMIEDAINKKRS